MTTPKIIVHQWHVSPFCGKVRRMLEHKGLAYETVNYNGLMARKASNLTSTGKLPVIDYDGERIQDSVEIADFLQARHPEPPFYPADPQDRHDVHLYEDWAGESLYWFEVYFRFAYDEAFDKAVTFLSEGRPGFERTLMKIVLKGMYQKKLHAQGIGRQPRDRIEARFQRHLDSLETRLADRSWLVGEQKTIADIAVASQLQEVIRTSHLARDIRSRTTLTGWLDRIDG